MVSQKKKKFAKCTKHSTLSCASKITSTVFPSMIIIRIGNASYSKCFRLTHSHDKDYHQATIPLVASLM